MIRFSFNTHTFPALPFESPTTLHSLSGPTTISTQHRLYHIIRADNIVVKKKNILNLFT